MSYNPSAGGGSVANGDKGDITVSGGGATWTLDNGAVTNAKLANVATASIKGRTTAGTGAPEDLTGTQATALLDTFTSGAKGLAPASGGGTANFLRADGTWIAPAGPGTGSGSFALISTWTYSTNVANVDFTNLGSYSDLLIITRGIAHSVSSQIALLLSVNNGSTFFNTTGDYVAIPASGAEATAAIAAINSANSATAKTAVATILAINTNNAPKIIDRMSRDDAGPIIFVGSLSPVNAIRVIPSLGGNITAGTIYLFGR